MAELAIFVINLDARPDRMASVAGQLEREGLAYIRIAAFDGRKIDPASIPEYDRAQANSWFGRELSGGEVGCYVSHLRAIDAFLASNAEFGLVLEDDVALPDSLSSALPNLIAQVRTVKGGFALANLGYPTKMANLNIGQIRTPAGSVNLCRAFYPPLMANALLWSRSGAKEFRETCSVVKAPIDDFLRLWGAGTQRILGVFPELIPVGLDNDSDISSNGAPTHRKDWRIRDPKAHARYQRKTFRAKVRAYMALVRARLIG